MPLHLEIVTAERTVLSDDVDMVNVPAIGGRMGILPRHEPVLTMLIPGEMTIVKGGERTPFAITGGFIEVLPHRVTILADTAERADEIDEARAEEARQQAEEALREVKNRDDLAAATVALQRANVRLKVARSRRGDRAQYPTE